MTNVIKPSTMEKARALITLAQNIRRDLAKFAELHAEMSSPKVAGNTPLSIATTHQILNQAIGLLKLHSFGELIKGNQEALLSALSEQGRASLTSAPLSLLDQPIPAYRYEPKLAVSAKVVKEASMLALMQMAIDHGADDLLERRVRGGAVTNTLGVPTKLGGELLEAGLISIESRQDWSVTKAK